MNQKQETAITPTRADDFPEWYQQVVKAAELAEASDVRGCMVIRPWGYGIWENLQRELDRRIKATGHENAYFPLFIPVSFLEKEASHVEGFAKECAVVTHHRLEMKEGKMIPSPSAKLEEPLVVRPTSETIIGASFSRWVQSYRDLPLLINQWCNVVRWEMRTRVFLRTAEFLWQEGHTAHASADEALEETRKMHEVYREFAENVLAMPVIKGEKSAGERFPGAVNSFTVEAMMQDRKALQAGTSHYLGQNFAHASGVKFLNKDGKEEFAYTTSWGMSTRLIGGMIMTHSDDDGLRIPPRVAPKQIVILPVVPKPELQEQVWKYCEELAADLKKIQYHGNALEVTVDKRDLRGGEKSWQWIKRGIPLRVEVGPRDIEKGCVMMMRRDQSPKEKLAISRQDLAAKVLIVLDEIQANYFRAAQNHMRENINSSLKDYAEFTRFFTPKNQDKPEIHGGFVNAKWCDGAACEEKIHELKVSIRCLPLEQSGTEGRCIICGAKAKTDALFGKSY